MAAHLLSSRMEERTEAPERERMNKKEAVMNTMPCSFTVSSLSDVIRRFFDRDP